MEENIRYAYRTCPCFSYDVEGIQTWLEDLAAEGLILESDGTFLGIFTFQKGCPQKIRYRLAPVQKKAGFFTEDEEPDGENREFSKSCGWEYVVRYGQFHIYRTPDPNTRPLHTDPTVHIMALQAVKKQQLSTVIGLVINFVLYSFLSTSIFSFFRSGAVIGLGFLASFLVFGLCIIGHPILGLIRLSQYQKKIRGGDSLDHPKPWKPMATLVQLLKLLPLAALVALFVFWGVSANRAYQRVDVDVFTPSIAYADLRSVFPEGTIQRNDMGDYNTAVGYSTALSSNIEWNEAATITDDTGAYHCILRMEYHDTVNPFFAKGLARDYYRQERLRYHGKRFEDLTVPETALEEVRVYSSYGILHILIRHENTVVHAVVNISQQGEGNHWERWLYQMEEILLNRTF